MSTEAQTLFRPAPFIAATLATAAAMLLLVAMPLPAADHLDAPGLTAPGGDPALDITDIYAFPSQDCAECTVLVMGVNGLSSPGKDVPFDRKTRYVFHIDRNGDALRDLTFTVHFKKPNKDGRQRMAVRAHDWDGPGGKILRFREGSTTLIGEDPLANMGRRGIRVFAGMQDDPFFFDLPGFVALDFCATDPAADTFAGTNIGAIVLEVPNSLLSAGTDFGVWGATLKQGRRVDRKGRPAINTVFIPTNPINGGDSLKDAFNAGSPETDREEFRDTVIDTLLLLGNDAATAGALADFLLPDILTVSLAEETGFPNGRRPEDDVIDTELGLITGGAIVGDCVDQNDVPFVNTFPFLGKPHV